MSHFGDPTGQTSKTFRSGPVSELFFPRPDFDSILDREDADAREFRKIPPAKRTIKRRVLDWIEGPWAPDNIDLPHKRTPEMSGNSPFPFRTRPESADARRSRQDRLLSIYKSEQRIKLGDWSTVFTYDVPIQNLPEEFEGMTILHLSDVHFSRHDARPEREIVLLEKWLHARAKRIDLMALSGDIITTAPDDLSKLAIFALRRISEAAAESVFVYGNHDFHGHTPAFISRELERFQLFDMNNQRARIKMGGSAINLIGVDDAYFGRPTAPASLNTNDVNIVVTHNLDAIRRNFPPHVDLILSGHTHWGEIWPVNGTWLMNQWGYCDNVNNHTRHWDTLTDRTLSFVHPGLARYYVRSKYLRQPPGFVIHTLRRAAEPHDCGPKEPGRYHASHPTISAADAI